MAHRPISSRRPIQRRAAVRGAASLRARGEILRYISAARQRSPLPIIIVAALIPNRKSAGRRQRMFAGIGTFGFSGSAGLALSSGVSYGSDPAGLRKSSSGIRFTPESARSPRNIAQQPARRGIEDSLHEE